MSDAALGWVCDGTLRLRIEREFPLSQAAEAHRQLRGRATTGKLLLIPGAQLATRRSRHGLGASECPAPASAHHLSRTSFTLRSSSPERIHTR